MGSELMDILGIRRRRRGGGGGASSSGLAKGKPGRLRDGKYHEVTVLFHLSVVVVVVFVPSASETPPERGYLAWVR